MSIIGYKTSSSTIKTYCTHIKKHSQYSHTNKKILNTEHYIHLEEAYFQDTEEEFVTKVASNVKEAIPLIEAGFVEASDFDGVKIFKIPKSRVEPVN